MSDQTPRFGEAIAPPQRNLQGAFGRKKTGAKPRPQTPVGKTTADRNEAAPSPSKQVPEAVAEPTVTSSASTVGERPTETETPPTTEADGVAPPHPAVQALTVLRNVMLTDDVVALVREARVGPERRTTTKVILDALTATHQQLPQLIAEDLAPTVIRGSLFEEVVTTTASPPKRSLRIEPTRAQLAVIDQLVETTGAKDRSHMLSVALKAYLGT